MSDDFYDEYYQAQRMKEGLDDPQVDATVPTITTLAGDLKPTAAPSAQPERIPGEVATMDRYAAEEIGNAEGDGILKTIAKGVVNGTIKAGESVTSMMAAGLNNFVPAGSDFRFKAPVPATFDTNTGGRLVEGVTQFGVQFYTGGNVLKAAKLLQGGGKLVGATRSVVKGVYADFTAFRGDEERLSNFLTQFDNPLLNNAVTQYLAADRDDGEFEGRLKNVVEGGIAGLAIDAVIPALRGIKKAKKALFDGDPKLASDIMEDSKLRVAEVIDANRDKFAAEVGEGGQLDLFEEARARTNKAAPVNDTVWDPKMGEATISAIKALKTEDPDTFIQSATDIIGQNIHIDKLQGSGDVEAVMGALSEVKVPEFATWSHDTQLKMAQSRGMDVPTLRRYMELGAVNEHVLLSSEILLKHQSQLVTDLINKNIDNNHILAEVAKYQELLDMTASFKNISGRALDANRISLDLKKKDVESAQRFMAERFGMDKNFDKFKEAWVASEGDLAQLAQLNKMSVSRIAADSAVEIWKNGLLSGIKTFGVNFAGNYANLYKEIGVRFFSGLSGTARAAMGGLPPGSERVYMGEALAMAQAQVDGLMDSVISMSRLAKNPNFLKDFNIPKSATDKAELGYTRKISADYWGMGTAPGSMARYIEKMTGMPGMKTQAAMRRSVDLAGSIINTPGNLLNMTDGISQNSARRTQRYAMAYRKSMQEGLSPAEAMSRVRQLSKDNEFIESTGENVEAFAKRVTFQDEMGAIASGVTKVVKGYRPYMDIPVLEFLMPFIRTPVNIFKQGVTEVNPIVNAFSATDPNSVLRQSISEGGIKADEALGRASFGLAVSTAAVLYATQGVITGAGPSHDPAMMETLRRSGWRPYSIRVENGVDKNGIQQYKYYSYQRIEPASWLMGSVATTIEQLHYTSSVNDRKEEQWGDYANSVMTALTEATLDKSFFVGVTNFIEALSDPKRFLPRYAANLTASAIPAISRDIEMMLQEKAYLRDIRSVQDAINNKLIGRSGEIPVARNRWGDPIAMDKGWILGHRSHFSPIGMSDEYAQPIDKEISRLAIEGVPDGEGNNRVFTNAMLSKPHRYVVKGGVTIKFDNGQYSRLLEIAGKEIKRDPFNTGEPMNLRDALNYLVTKSESYKAAGTYNPNHPVPGPFPETQARLIKNVAKGYDEAARLQLYSEYPDLQKKLQDAERYDMMSKAGIQRPEDQYKLLEDLNGGQ